MHGWHLFYVYVRPIPKQHIPFTFEMTATQARIEQFKHIKFHVSVQDIVVSANFHYTMYTVLIYLWILKGRRIANSDCLTMRDNLHNMDSVLGITFTVLSFFFFLNDGFVLCSQDFMALNPNVWFLVDGVLVISTMCCNFSQSTVKIHILILNTFP